MDTITGYIDRIVYRNKENGYSVLSVTYDNDEITCVGTFQYISEGEYVELSGHYTEHQLYGEQLVVEKYEIKAPEDTESIIRYLSAGAIKGIGSKLAERIVRRFKEDTFRIIEEEPERLAEIKGISLGKAMEISTQIEEKKDMRKAMIFFGDYGISASLAIKIYNQYGQESYEMLKKNPYKLAEDIEGIGFKTADEIAARVGINTDSDFRIRSACLYALLQASSNGHSYLPIEELIRETYGLLGIQNVDVEKHIMDLSIDKKLIIKKIAGDNAVYASNYYYTELNIARMLLDMSITAEINEEAVRKKLTKIESSENIELDECQKKAVVESVSSGLLVITGGPGTGKTTTINTIIKYFESEGLDILLAAPTGRAAKRMTEATGYEAQTIHRLLEITGVPDDESIGTHFERNEQNPLEADVIIIDEMSMVDMFLMHSLLKAVSVGTRLILVGDVNQLPSVGPGNVLKDIISSGKFNVVMLTKIFRQASQSDIIVNAHKINEGEQVDLKKSSKDFLFLKRMDANAVINAMITLIKDKLPKYVEADMLDIQVLTPMKKGLLGVENINEILQQYLNPKSDDKREKETNSGLFREGDKVMQIKNNYQLEWEVRSRYGIAVEGGSGIFNGDMGIIRTINTYAENMEVEFDEHRFATYSFKQLEELELAYAVTIHKSQGSEYPAVILPLLSGPRMLMNRNLLYTAVTRAKKCVCIVGIEEAVGGMIENVNEQRRYSGLSEIIKTF